MTLPQQLEDKKKGLMNDQEMRDYIMSEFVNSGFITVHQWRNFVDYLQIMIKRQLEQAIGEIKSKDEEIFELECKYKRALEGWVDNENLLQKQRQEEIEFLDGIIICGFTTDGEMHKGLSEHNALIGKRIEQLNQPKTEE